MKELRLILIWVIKPLLIGLIILNILEIGLLVGQNIIRSECQKVYMEALSNTK